MVVFMSRTNENGGRVLGRFLMLLSFMLLAAHKMIRMPSMFKTLIVIFSSSVCVVYIVVPFAMRLARRFGAMDFPGARRIHSEPTPRWGGLAVYAGVMVALLLTSILYMPNLQSMILSSTIILFVGLLDDVVNVKAWIKLLFQVGACVLLIVDGVHVTFLPDCWWGIAGEWLITVVWIVGITNAVNFLDGMDGLVSGLVAGTSLIYFVLSLLTGSVMLSYCSMALFGACLCFLSYNVKPARIFLGDSGSTFLGFFLAAMSIHGEWARHDPIVSFFIPILVLSIPIYDMVFTTIARISDGRVTSVRTWLEFTGKDHLHHRLERLGLTRGWVVATICFLNIGIGLGAVTLHEARTYGGVALIVQAVCVYIVLALLEVLGGRNIVDGK